MSDKLTTGAGPISVEHTTDAQGRRVARIEETTTATVKPNHQPRPGPIANAQGIIVPDTEANPYGDSAPPIEGTPEEAGWWGRWGGAIHTGLDLVGLIPVVGEIADGANALIYLAEGDAVNAALSAAAMVPGAGMAATGAKLGKKAAGAVAEGAGKTAGREAGREAAEQGARRSNGRGGGKDKGRGRRRPKRRCELVPYNQLQCAPGQERHHVVPDWMLRTGKRGGGGRIPGMPSLGNGPAICLESGAGNTHNTAHKHTDRPAQRVARGGRGTGTPGTLQLGQAKVISARAIEKATGGPKKGGCDRKDIQKQLDEMFKAPDSAAVRGVRDARGVTQEIQNAIQRRGDY